MFHDCIIIMHSNYRAVWLRSQYNRIVLFVTVVVAKCRSNHINVFHLQDGILVGAVGAYDWNGAVLKETRQGKVVPPKSSYTQEFPEELKNHGAYLGE